MTFSYDPTTEAGRVRLLATDTDSERPIFDDEEIAAFLTIEGADMPAAALALETIAANEALVEKRITLLDLKTDGPAVCDALLKRARQLRETASAGTCAFATAEFADDAWQRAEKLLKVWGS